MGKKGHLVSGRWIVAHVSGAVCGTRVLGLPPGLSVSVKLSSLSLSFSDVHFFSLSFSFKCTRIISVVHAAKFVLDDPFRAPLIFETDTEAIVALTFCGY